MCSKLKCLIKINWWENTFYSYKCTCMNKSLIYGIVCYSSSSFHLLVITIDLVIQSDIFLKNHEKIYPKCWKVQCEKCNV